MNSPPPSLLLSPSEVAQLLAVQAEAHECESLYSIYLYAIFVISSIPLLANVCNYNELYSKLRPEFQHVIWHAMGVTTALMIIMVNWQPVPLVIAFGGYSLGVIKGAGPLGFMVAMWACWTCIAHLGVTFMLVFVIQSYQLKVFGEKLAILDWLSTPGNSLRFLNFSLIFHMLFVTSIGYNCYANSMDLRAHEELTPLLTEHPSTILIRTRGNTPFIAFSLSTAIVICVEIVCCLCSNFVIFRAIRSTSQLVSKKTLRLQTQMHKLFSFQLLILIIFFYIPIIFLVLQAIHLVHIPVPNFICLCICVMCWHAPLQMSVQYVRLSAIRRRRASSAIDPGALQGTGAPTSSSQPQPAKVATSEHS